MDSVMNEASKSLTPEALSWIQQRCNEQIASWFSDKIKEIRVNFVIDSNIVIQSLVYYAKEGKQSILFKLADNPVFSLYAPSRLGDEVDDYIENKRKETVDKIRLQEAWSLLRKQIIVHDVKCMSFEKSAAEIIGHRDKDDVQFVGAYLEMGAAGILTEDSHFDHPDIQKFSLSDLGDIVGTYHRGMLSFLVVGEVLPRVLGLTIDVLMVVAKILFDLVKIVFSVVKSLVTGMVSGFAKLLSWVPPELVLTLMLAALAYLILDSGARDKILEKFENIWDSVKPMAKNAVDSLKNMILALCEKILVLAPYLGVTSQQFLKDIADFKDQVRLLNLEDAGYFS